MSSTRTGSAVWRMTFAYLGAFVLCMAFVAWVVSTLLDHSLLKQLDNRLLTVGADVARNATTPEQARAEVQRRVGTTNEYLYRISGVEDDPQTIIPKIELGCQSFAATDVPEDGEQGDAFRACAFNTNGYVITVASDIDAIEDTTTTMQTGLLGSALLALLLAFAAIRQLSRHYLRRLDNMRKAANTIADGNHETRLAVSVQNDEFDRVASSFNTMLSRQHELIEAHKHVGSSIAHDIRTPLTRLRNRIETSQGALGPDLALQLTDDVDAILALSASLLRLAEIDNTSDQKHWRTFDLAKEVQSVVETFEPSYADAGLQITYGGVATACLRADQGLLQQLTVNLIENALRHTTPGTQVAVSVTKSNSKIMLEIKDNGPGLPTPQIERIAQTYFKVDRGGNSHGHGLGLALVAAIARHHKSRLVALNLSPGLSVRIEFPLESVLAT